MSGDGLDLAAKREQIAADGEALFSEEWKAVKVGPSSIYVCISSQARTVLDVDEGDALDVEIHPDRLVVRPVDDEGEEE